MNSAFAEFMGKARMNSRGNLFLLFRVHQITGEDHDIRSGASDNWWKTGVIFPGVQITAEK